jgi:hypothetical protein
MTTHLAVSPLTGRIFQGRLNKGGDAYVGEKKDVTSSVLRCVIEKAEFHGGEFEIEGGGRKWAVQVVECVGDGVKDLG